jgi:hypothetical protein
MNTIAEILRDCAYGLQQLSGLGFSSTQRNSVLCRVSGSFSRVIKIVF